MYLKAFNRSGATSNGITAGKGGIITSGFSVLQTNRNANIEEINFADASANPFGTDTSITGITAASFPVAGETKYDQAFAPVADEPIRVEIIRPLSSDVTDYGILFNRGFNAGLSSDGRQTSTDLGGIINSDGLDIPNGLATVGTEFRLVDTDNVPVTTAMTVVSVQNAASFAWVRIANIANADEITDYFTDDSVYEIQADNDVVQASGRQLRVEILTNAAADSGNGVWELYNDKGTKIASN